MVVVSSFSFLVRKCVLREEGGMMEGKEGKEKRGEERRGDEERRKKRDEERRKKRRGHSHLPCPLLLFFAA